MPWSVDGPSSRQLGLVRRRDGGRDWGEAPRRYPSPRHPVRRWIIVALVLVAVTLVVLAGAASMRRTDRGRLAEDAAGTWLQSGSIGSIVVVTRIANADGTTKRVVVSGKLDGHPVRGSFAGPAYPSLSTRVWVDLLGRRWELRLPSPHTMTLTDASGRVISLTRV